MKTLLDDLKKQYGYNNPILLNDISNKENNAQIRQYLLRKYKEGKISKAGRGIYYFATNTLVGQSVPHPDAVCFKKYIKDATSPEGFYGGPYLINEMHLTTQVPAIIDIYTNNTASRNRIVYIENIPYRIHRCNVKITGDNWKGLQILELLRYMQLSEIKRNSDRIINYIKSEHIEHIIKNNISSYPTATYKKIVEGGMGFVFA